MSYNPGINYHLTDTMVREHETILGHLERLERHNRTIQRAQTAAEVSDSIAAINGLAADLIAAEPHHQREEQVLFPELEKRGIAGPPAVMRQEHIILRRCKHQIKELTDSTDVSDFGAFKSKLQDVVIELLQTLREHIAKENNILYPMAQRFITEPEVWARMKDDGDAIGYMPGI